MFTYKYLSPVPYPKRYVNTRECSCGSIEVQQLIIEKYVWLQYLENQALFYTTQEERLIDRYAPCSHGVDNTLMRRCISRGNY